MAFVHVGRRGSGRATRLTRSTAREARPRRRTVMRWQPHQVRGNRTCLESQDNWKNLGGFLTASVS